MGGGGNRGPGESHPANISPQSVHARQARRPQGTDKHLIYSTVVSSSLPGFLPVDKPPSSCHYPSDFIGVTSGILRNVSANICY